MGGAIAPHVHKYRVHKYKGSQIQVLLCRHFVPKYDLINFATGSRSCCQQNIYERLKIRENTCSSDLHLFGTFMIIRTKPEPNPSIQLFFPSLI